MNPARLPIPPLRLSLTRYFAVVYEIVRFRSLAGYSIFTQFCIDISFARRDFIHVGRRRKAWLPGGDGKLKRRGKNLSGFYVLWHEYVGDGRRISHSKHFLSVSAARTWVRQYNAKLDLGAIAEIAAVPYVDAVEEFLAGCSTLSHGTMVQYASALGMFRVMVEDRDVHEVTGSDIDRFVTWRLAESTEATTAKHVRALRRFFRWALKRGMTLHNPLEQATALPSDRVVREKPVLTEDDIGRLIAALDTEDRKLGVQLAVTTGLDRSVIANLRASQVDVPERCIRVQRPKTRRRRPETLVVPLHRDIVPALADKIAGRQPGEPLLRGLARQESHEDWWKLAVQKAGLDGLRFADLRAVAASRMQRAVSLVDTQRLLGHSSPELTARHYTVVNPDVQQRLDTLPLPGGQKSRPAKRSKSASAGQRG